MEGLRPVVNISGELVALGPWERHHLSHWHRWLNDFDVMRLDMPTEAQPVTIDELETRFDRQIERPAADRFSVDRIRFAVFETETWQLIGTTSLFDIDFRNRTAELGIKIGEAEYRGRGYGTEATKLTVDYAFTVLGLHNVMLATLEYNAAGLRAYTKAGFREVGRRRESVTMSGKRYDQIFMDCVATDFESPAFGRVFTPETNR
jgi:diamine N-acetyltransferase